jgi:hypothetical protein
MKIKLVFFYAGLLLFANCFPQQAEPPKLLYREDWNEKPPFDLMTAYSLTQADVLNPDLIQTLYGPAQDSIKKRHHGSATDAYYIYTGFCRSTWALALSNKNFYVDLSGEAVIRCRLRNSGLRDLHIIIQSASGNWFVSDKAAKPSSVWQVYDFIVKDINWNLLNIQTVNPGNPVNDPVLHYGSHWLRQIDKIGFTDLMNGGLSAACSRVDWIEVYANSARR